MRIRCHAEHNGLGIVLSRIETMENAESMLVFFLEKGIAAAIAEPRGAADHRVFLPGSSMEVFARLIAGSNIQLID